MCSQLCKCKTHAFPPTAMSLRDMLLVRVTENGVGDASSSWSYSCLHCSQTTQTLSIYLSGFLPGCSEGLGRRSSRLDLKKKYSTRNGIQEGEKLGNGYRQGQCCAKPVWGDAKPPWDSDPEKGAWSRTIVRYPWTQRTFPSGAPSGIKICILKSSFYNCVCIKMNIIQVGFIIIILLGFFCFWFSKK